MREARPLGEAVARGADQPRPGALPDLSRLSIIIPAYNEEAGIGDTVARLCAACPAAEIVVVDDGSTDGTRAIVLGRPEVRLVSHRRNRGYGAAIKTGIRQATRPFVAWYDADGQHNPHDLVAVVTPVLADESDVVIGVRGRESAEPLPRLPGKWLLAWVARIVSGEPIPDLNSGLRCFRADVLRRYLHLLPDGFSASTTSTLMMLKGGHRVGYVPIVTQPRVGRSSVKIVSDGLRTLHLIVRIVVLFEAFRVFAVLGLMMLVPGLAYGLAVAIVRGQGFPTLAGTAVIAGLLTFFMGIVADQVVELRKERLEPADLDPRR